MNTLLYDRISRRTTELKAAIVTIIIQGKGTVAEPSRSLDLPPSKSEERINQRTKGVEHALRAKPLDVKEQCAHGHRFESVQHAIRVIDDWIGFYNHRHQQKAHELKTPALEDALTA